MRNWKLSNVFTLCRSWHSVVTTTEGVFVIGGEGSVKQVKSLQIGIVIVYFKEYFGIFIGRRYKKGNKQNSKCFIFKNENVDGNRC